MPLGGNYSNYGPVNVPGEVARINKGNHLEVKPCSLSVLVYKVASWAKNIYMVLNEPETPDTDKCTQTHTDTQTNTNTHTQTLKWTQAFDFVISAVKSLRERDLLLHWVIFVEPSKSVVVFPGQETQLFFPNSG